jgi:molybdate transport system permease protein
MSAVSLAAIWMSLQLAAITLLIATPLSIALAWWMARSRWRGKLLIDSVILLPLGLPAAVIGFWVAVNLNAQSPFGLWLHQSLGLTEPLYPAGAVLAACVLTVPMMARTLRPAFEAIDPMLHSVACTLGATGWHAWRTVTLPLSMPAIGSTMALGFAAAWGETGAMLMLIAALSPHEVESSLHTVPLVLWQTLSAGAATGHAWELTALCLGVSSIAIVLSELLRRQWQRRWLGHSHSTWRGERP